MPVRKAAGIVTAQITTSGRNLTTRSLNVRWNRRQTGSLLTRLASFKHGAETTTARIQNGQYQIVTLGLENKRQPCRVERVIGHDPLLQFLTPLPGGRYQVQEASYDPKSNQWFHVYGEDLRFPGEFGHWTGRGMNWNSMCAECHNTRLKKNYDAATDSYHTTMAEMAVGCEACHGPLKAHNEWRKNAPKHHSARPHCFASASGSNHRACAVPAIRATPI